MTVIRTGKQEEGLRGDGSRHNATTLLSSICVPGRAAVAYRAKVGERHGKTGMEPQTPPSSFLMAGLGLVNQQG